MMKKENTILYVLSTTARSLIGDSMFDVASYVLRSKDTAVHFNCPESSRKTQTRQINFQGDTQLLGTNFLNALTSELLTSHFAASLEGVYDSRHTDSLLPHPVCSELEKSGIKVAVGDSELASALSNRQNCTCARKTQHTLR